MENSELRSKKKIPAWALITGAILIILLAVGFFFMVTSGSRTSREVKEKLALADRYMTELNYQQAIAVYDQILQIDPKNTTVVSQMAEAYVTWAKAEEAAGNVPHALEILAEGYEKTKRAALYDEREAMAERNGITSSQSGAVGQGSVASNDSSSSTGKVVKVTAHYPFRENENDHAYDEIFTFEYDNAGKLIMRSSSVGFSRVEYTYDEEGNLLTARKYSYTDEVLCYCEFDGLVDGKRQYRYKGDSYGSLEFAKTLLIDQAGYYTFIVTDRMDYVGNPLRYEITCDPRGKLISFKILFDADEVMMNEWNGTETVTVKKPVTDDSRINDWEEYLYDETGSLREILRHKNYTTNYEWSVRFEYSPDGGVTRSTYYSDRPDMKEEYDHNGLLVGQVAYSSDDGSVTYVTECEYNEKRDKVREQTQWADGSGTIYEYVYSGDKVTVNMYDLDGNYEGSYDNDYYPSVSLAPPVPKEGFEVYGDISWMISDYEIQGQSCHVLPGSHMRTPIYVEYEYDSEGRVSRKTTYTSDGLQSFYADYEYLD